MELTEWFLVTFVVAVLIAIIIGVALSKRKRKESMEILLSHNKPVIVYPPWDAFPGNNLVDNNPRTIAQSAYWLNPLPNNKTVYAEIDLGKKFLISRVVIYNRTDCLRQAPLITHHRLLSTAEETAHQGINPAPLDCNKFGEYKLFIDNKIISEYNADGAVYVIHDSLNIIGRKVKIEFLSGVINISGIEVFGHPI